MLHMGEGDLIFLSDGIKWCQIFQLVVFHMSVYISGAVEPRDDTDGAKR